MKDEQGQVSSSFILHPSSLIPSSVWRNRKVGLAIIDENPNNELGLEPET
jgi:hypothetical protein